MEFIDVRVFEEDFVIYFGGEQRRINAYTLASSLVSISDAVKSANSLINPGYNVEVVVEAFGEGSFKVKVKTLYDGAKNLFSKENAKAIVLAVIASYVYENTIAPDAQVNVIVNENEVIIEDGDKRVVVPREVHDRVKEVEKSEKFKNSIGRTFKAINEDTDIESFGITPSMTDITPLINIPREKFSLLTETTDLEDNQRVIVEIAELYILRAILDRGARKWEFVWRGITISAPVVDQKFYDDFFAHKIMIAPGDSIEVKLKIFQSRDLDTGIFTNQRYEVLEVLRHIPKLKQSQIDV